MTRFETKFLLAVGMEKSIWKLTEFSAVLAEAYTYLPLETRLSTFGICGKW